MPRVTVVIPTHNRAAYLRPAIESVLAQTFGDLELVVCDNASTDETPAVIGSIDDPRLRHVRWPENVGMVENHRLALQDEVSGEFALMISDDDLLDPTLLEHAVAVLDANPRVGMVHSAFRIIGAGGEVLRPFDSWTGGPDHDVVEPGAEFMRRSMDEPCRVCASTAVMRSAARPTIEHADYPPIDVGMWLRLSVSWDVAYVHRVLASYRVHEATHSASFGAVSGAGYTFARSLIEDVHRVKIRFLDEHAEALSDTRSLRRAAERARRRELLVRVRQTTLPERRRSATAREIWEAARVDPLVLAERDAWALAAGSLIGPALVARLKRG